MGLTAAALFSKYGPQAGAAAQGASEALAKQRDARLQMEMDREGLRQGGEKNYVDALFTREALRNDNANDAWKRMLQADYVQQGGTQTPGLSPYSRPVQGPGAQLQAIAGNSGLWDELERRAHYWDPINPTNPEHTNMQLRRLALPGSESTPNVYGQMDRLTRPSGAERSLGLLGLFGKAAKK